MAEQGFIGGAYVEIGAKTEKLDAALNQAEQKTDASLKKIEEASQGAAGEMRQVQMAAEDTSGSVSSVAGAYLQYRGARSILGDLIGRTRILGGVTVALTNGIRGAFATLARAAAPVLLLVFLGDLIRLLKAIPGAVTGAIDAIRNLTFDDVLNGINSVAAGIGNLISSLPILGGAMKRTISEVSDLFGGPNFVREIEAANKAIKEAENRMLAMAKAADIAGDALQRMKDVQRGESRRGALVGTEGIERIRLEEQFRSEDIDQQAMEAGLERFRAHVAAVEELRARLEAGEIDQSSFDTQLDTLQNARGANMAQLEAARVRAQAIAAETGAKRIAEFKAQEAEAAQLAERENAREVARIQSELAQERLRALGLGFEAQAEAIRQGYRDQVMQAEREGHDQRAALLERLSEARIEAMRAREQQIAEARAQAIGEAQADIHQQLERARVEMQGDPLALRMFDIDADISGRIDEARAAIERLTEAQQKLIGAGLGLDEFDRQNSALAEQIEAYRRLIEMLERLGEARKQAAESDSAEERAEKLADIQFQIRQQQMRNQGFGIEARMEEVAREFNERIAEAIDAGDLRLARSLRMLGAARIEGLEGLRDEDNGRARQIDLSRTAFNQTAQGPQKQKVEDPQLKETNRLLKDIRDRGTPATAGPG